jgi:hypothetical protein
LKTVTEASALERSRLTPPDLALVIAKHHGNRLGFAVLLAFFRSCGRFPRIASEIDPLLVEEIAQQLAIVVPPALCRAWRDGLPNGIVPKSARWQTFEKPLSPMLRCSKIGCAVRSRLSVRFRISSLYFCRTDAASLGSNRLRPIGSIASSAPQSTLMMSSFVPASSAALPRRPENGSRRCCVGPGTNLRIHRRITRAG